MHVAIDINDDCWRLGSLFLPIDARSGDGPESLSKRCSHSCSIHHVCIQANMEGDQCPTLLMCYHSHYVSSLCVYHSKLCVNHSKLCVYHSELCGNHSKLCVYHVYVLYKIIIIMCIILNYEYSTLCFRAHVMYVAF